MEKKQPAHFIGNILCGGLTTFGAVASILSLLSGSNGIWFLGDCAILLIIFLIIFYTFFGYREPHGNMLKYIILIYAALRLIAIRAAVQSENTGLVIALAVETGLMCYMAGRLAKVKENMVLMGIVTAGLAITMIVRGTDTIGAVTPLIIWLDICVAYFLRYKEHREAGLEDAVEK